MSSNNTSVPQERKTYKVARKTDKKAVKSCIPKPEYHARLSYNILKNFHERFPEHKNVIMKAALPILERK